MSERYILVLNPGSTSTKVAVYRDRQEVDSRTLEHPAAELRSYPTVNDQLPMRLDAVHTYLSDIGFPLSRIAAIAARGGVIGEMESGAYRINEELAARSRVPKAQHAANLAPQIAHRMARETGIPAYVYDMVCGCGTPDPLFTISGSPEMGRVFLTHVLNSRAVCHLQAEREGRGIAETTHIVTHMGGGITTNLVKGGRILDLVADDEGTFSPERSGGVPCRKLVKLCYSGRYTESEAQAMLKGRGGLLAFLGTTDLREVEERIDAGDGEAQLVFEAMALQIAKDIASLFPSVHGEVDSILLTGGMAHSKRLTEAIRRRIAFLAPVHVWAGSFEMQALAHGVLRVLDGAEEAHVLGCMKEHDCFNH